MHSTEKWRGRMGICYILFTDTSNDGARGTTWKTQDWPMAQMCINHNQTRKHYGKPTKIKMRTWEVLRQNSRLRKILKDFRRNEICTQYRYRKSKTKISRKYVHVPRLCAKSYWRYISHVNYTHKIIYTKSWRHMVKQNLRRVCTKKIKYQGRLLYPTKWRWVL